MRPPTPQLRSSNERRVHFAMADLIDVCLIFRAVFGVPSGRIYCYCLGLNEEMIKRLLVDGRYRGWAIVRRIGGVDRRAE